MPVRDVSILIPVNCRPRQLGLVLTGIAAMRLPEMAPAGPAATDTAAAPFRGEVIVRHTGEDPAITKVVNEFQALPAFSGQPPPRGSNAGTSTTGFSGRDIRNRLDKLTHSAGAWKLRYDHCPVDSGNRSENRNAAISLSTGRRLIGLDADCIPTRDFLREHWRLLTPGHFVCGDALRLERNFSDLLSRETVADEDPRDWLGPKLQKDQQCRRARAQRHIRSGQIHKVPLQGGNFSCWREDMLAINGFDRHYAGWGQEDTDIGTRLLLLGRTPVNGGGAATALHIWHPPFDRPAEWKEGVNVGYFSRPGRMVRCRHGLADRPPKDIAWWLDCRNQGLNGFAEKFRTTMEELGYPPASSATAADWVICVAQRPTSPRAKPTQIGIGLSATGPGLMHRALSGVLSLGGLAGWGSACWWLVSCPEAKQVESAVPERLRGQVAHTPHPLGSDGWFAQWKEWVKQLG